MHQSVYNLTNKQNFQLDRELNYKRSEKLKFTWRTRKKVREEALN